MRSLALGLVALSLPSLWSPGTAAAAPRCQVTAQPIVLGRVRASDGKSPAKLQRAVDARRGDTLDVYLEMPGLLDGKKVVFADDGARGHASWSGSGCGPLTVSWRKVEPRMQHTHTPSPNKDIAVYANAVVFGPSHGEWIGYDRIEYFETPLDAPAEGATTLAVRDASPSEPGTERPATHVGLGTMRLAATVRFADGSTRATPDARDSDGGMISERVFRYDFRLGDGFLGWLTSWYNVPYLFGSAGKGARNQAERYLGGDCADVLVAALRRAGRRDLEYSSVGGLVSSLAQVGGPVVVAPEGAQPETRLRFGDAVRPGDILALDYVGSEALPRDWDHIVVLVEDRGPDGKPDGVLGPEDLVADSGDSEGLKFAPLGDQGRVRVVALRARGVPAL